MSAIANFEYNQRRARDARREARDLREPYSIAKCGLDLRMNYGTKYVPSHIVRRIADQYPIWADEYDAIAEEIERELEANLTAPAHPVLTTESNLGISGDAQTAEELAGRGLNLLRDAFTTLDEAYRTVKRLRKEGALRQNRAQGSETVQVGTTGRLDELEAQTGAQHDEGER